jgi:alpha-beta hydrolase superfamily lysophospholipase
MGVALWIVIIVIAMVAGLSFVFAHMITHGKRQTLDESWEWELSHVPAVRKFSRDMLTDYVIKGPKGEDIHVALLVSPEPSDKYVILAHGYTDNRFGMMKYVPHYYNLGFNCILFDERGHGESAPEPCSYGPRELDYLMAVVKDTLERYGGSGFVLGLHGESLGGATVLMSLAEPLVQENVKFVVDDCGFADIVTVLKVGLKMYHVPVWFLYPALLAAWVMYGFKLWKARPIDYVYGNKIPLLCMHGAKDDFIVPEHSKRVYEATSGPREIHLFEGAWHAMSAVDRPEEDGEVLAKFLERLGL